jgi:hypothetical protein
LNPGRRLLELPAFCNNSGDTGDVRLRAGRLFGEALPECLR